MQSLMSADQFRELVGKDAPCLSKEKYRERLSMLEDELIQHEQVEMEVRHHFAHGTYARELHIPKGTVLTGKIHRHSCINILSKGKIKVVTDEGFYELEAPHTFVSGPDVKKAGYALEDSIWINVHPWDGEADLEQIEREVIISENLLEEGLCPGLQQQ